MARLAQADAPPAPLGHVGRWLTDGQGRALLLHGVNLVAKEPGQTPASMGFDADDAAWLVDNGFDVVRLGTTAASLMPTAGVLDEAYLDSFTQTVQTLTDAGLLVLVDLHQDGWGPTLGSDGFPGWMTVTHGATDTNTDFPLYYLTNPAIQAAFDSFWANEDGPDGVPLQDHVATMFGALAGRLKANPGVVGYDLLNEPWPGTTWSPCITGPDGCPTQDLALDGYYARMTAAIRAQDPTVMIYGEPYTLFNFGKAPTHITLPGNDPRSGMSYHLYPADASGELPTQQYAEQWSNCSGALMNTEFGATDDLTTIDRQVNLFDGSLVSWMWWAYSERMVEDLSQPPTDDNLNLPVVDTLVRPHPRTVAGTPTAQNFDRTDRVLRFSYSPDRVDGSGPFAAGPTTEIEVAPRTYPEGYQVAVTGGTVTSAPGAALLTVVADGSGPVLVKVWPAGQATPADTVQTAPVVTPTDCATAPVTPVTAPAAAAVVTPTAFTG